MTKFLCAIGVGLLVASAATATYLLLNKKKTKECDACSNCKISENQEYPKNNTSVTCTKVVQGAPLYEGLKGSAIGSMYARHVDAASIIKESVEAIRGNVKVSEDINNEIDLLSTELDKI